MFWFKRLSVGDASLVSLRCVLPLRVKSSTLFVFQTVSLPNRNSQRGVTMAASPRGVPRVCDEMLILYFFYVFLSRLQCSLLLLLALLAHLPVPLL